MAKWLRQRIANPSSPVRIRAAPLLFFAPLLFCARPGKDASTQTRYGGVLRREGISVEDNPYSSPRSELDRTELTIAEQEIRAVARVFRWIGWTGVVVCFPFFLRFCITLFREFFDPTVPLSPLENELLITAAMFFFYWYPWTARKMLERMPRIDRTAVLLSYVLILGFPIFTVAGIACLRKVRRHFDEFYYSRSENAS